MSHCNSPDRQFSRRVEAIPGLGFGLSVDVYSPDLFELMNRLAQAGQRPAYLEIFRAGTEVLRKVSRCLPDVPFAYHGEGLWITQPDFSAATLVNEELDDALLHVEILNSPWLNHECAAKQMAGYSFGTYLPPLYTADSARAVARNIAWVQQRMDERGRSGNAFGPLFVLEMPPLTYFMAGTMAVPDYFRLITDVTPCGLVLDIGHLWTLFRYSDAGRRSSIEQFVDRFLDEFPMERVIEIHVAGLAPHEAAMPDSERENYPEWIDAHAAPIPPVSWTMLEQVLRHPGLRNLRGIALEVDTKPIERIVEEFQGACDRFSATIRCLLRRESPAVGAVSTAEVCLGVQNGDIDYRRLEADYAEYAQIASGQRPPTGRIWRGVAEDSIGLERYIHDYMPHEILHWGGDLADMFPETCGSLSEAGVVLTEFVPWWFQKPRPLTRPYDFFLLKIDRVLEFVGERAPALMEVARREADALRSAYADANAGVAPFMEFGR
jgi:uncharacterized protein